MSNSIVVVGSSNIDFIMKMDHLPTLDESVADAEFMQTFGGKGANQAVAAARAGGNVTFVNCVGDDPYAAGMVAGYRESGVNTDHVIAASDISSGTALVMIGQGGHNYLSVAPGANYLLTPERIHEVEAVIASAAFVLMQFEILPQTIGAVLEIASGASVPVIWNIAPAREFDRAWLRKTTIVIANEPEATMITGIEVPDAATGARAAREICALGATTAIVTLGAGGSVVASRDSDGNLDTEHLKAFPVEPVDTTAAGDTYCGCLAVALAEGKSLAQAVTFAGAAAALSVQKMGAQPSTPWRPDIDAFLSQHESAQE